MTKIVLENILVLATGTELEKSGKQEKPAQVDVITLEVTPEEGEKLALAAPEGKLQLALRNYLRHGKQRYTRHDHSRPSLTGGSAESSRREKSPGGA